MLVKGKQGKGSLAPGKYQFTWCCIAASNAAACVMCKWLNMLLQGVKQHVFGKQRRRSASG